ncbi:Serine carboxypeptidase-like 12 [Camellia lanceoleosa]|uniref:Serine carboxypeptidase-like 12 n=1 Tax=Camellia lanceoleosa TaxID=1840588 RepID=A0ACC0GUX1_9ERIC|nr:Serine carboxypeptidase-like 12 [Camellia lanceoleosa]
MAHLLLILLLSTLIISCSNLVLCHSVVESLPGFEGTLPFELETGYVGVDESEDVQLFYYFVKSESNPKEDPLILWLTGGPGCSAFSAFIYEIGNEVSTEPLINLKGYILGNPVTTLDDGNYAIPFAHGMGLISDELYESLQRSCQGQYFNIDPSNARCLQDYQAYSQCIDGLNTLQILEPWCGFGSPKPQELFSERRSVDEKNIELVINALKLSHLWLNDDRVREALHIQKGSIGEWNRCTNGLPYTQSIWDSFQYHVNLSTKGYKFLIYR